MCHWVHKLGILTLMLWTISQSKLKPYTLSIKLKDKAKTKN